MCDKHWTNRHLVNTQHEIVPLTHVCSDKVKLFPVESIDRNLVVRSAVQVRLKLRWRCVRKDKPMVDNSHARAQFICLCHVVRCQNDRAFRLLLNPITHNAADDDTRLDIDAKRRLVEEQYLRVGDETAHQIDLLTHAGGQTVHLLTPAVPHSNNLQVFLDPGSRHRRLHTIELAEHPELLLDGENTIPRSLASGDEGDERAYVSVVLLDVEAGHSYTPRRGKQQRRHDFDDRCLAGTVRAQKTEYLAIRDVEADTPQRVERSSAPAGEDTSKVLYLNGCMHTVLPPKRVWGKANCMTREITDGLCESQ